jgi:hypothetical protein
MDNAYKLFGSTVRVGDPEEICCGWKIENMKRGHDLSAGIGLDDTTQSRPPKHIKHLDAGGEH